jgi:hypothetical protein
MDEQVNEQTEISPLLDGLVMINTENNMAKNWLSEAKENIAQASGHLTIAAIALQKSPEKVINTVDEMKKMIGDLQIAVEILKRHGA